MSKLAAWAKHTKIYRPIGPDKNIIRRILALILLGTSWRFVPGANAAFSPGSNDELVRAVDECRESCAGATCRVIDSAIHLWSDGAYPWASPPPTELQKAATAEAYIARAREAGVAGALVVQPAIHSYDHSYVTEVLKEHPDFFRGMGLANPTVNATQAVSELEALHAAGFVGVRFNAANFPGGVTSADGALNPTAGGLTSEVGQALYKRAGELGMPVGLMAFKGLAPFAVQVRTLCQQYPDTILIIDHLGFFRQPAIGGQLGNKAMNNFWSWRAVLSLAKYPQVYVKVSALFRASGEAPPFKDLVPKLGELLNAYGAERLMWGSDFPFVLQGGFPLPEGVTSTAAALPYDEAVRVVDEWALPGLDSAAREALMGGTAAKLFGF